MVTEEQRPRSEVTSQLSFLTARFKEAKEIMSLLKDADKAKERENLSREQLKEKIAVLHKILTSVEEGAERNKDDDFLGIEFQRLRIQAQQLAQDLRVVGQRYGFPFQEYQAFEVGTDERSLDISGRGRKIEEPPEMDEEEGEEPPLEGEPVDEEAERGRNQEREWAEARDILWNEIRDLNRKIESNDGREVEWRETFNKLLTGLTELEAEFEQGDYEDEARKSAQIAALQRALDRIEKRLGPVTDAAKPTKDEPSYEEWVGNADLHPEACRKLRQAITGDSSSGDLGILWRLDQIDTRILSIDPAEATFTDLVDALDEILERLEDLVAEVRREEKVYRNRGQTSSDDDRKADLIRGEYLYKSNEGGEGLIERIENLKLEHWKKRIPYDLDKAYSLQTRVDNASEYPDPDGKAARVVFLEWLSSIESLERSLKDAKSQAESNGFDPRIEIQQRDFLQKNYFDSIENNGELKKRRDLAYSQWENNVEEIYPELENLKNEVARITSERGGRDPNDLVREIDTACLVIQPIIDDVNTLGLEERHLSFLEDNYFNPARDLAGEITVDAEQWNNERNFDFIEGEVTMESALAWIRDIIASYEKSLDKRFGEQDDYTVVIRNIKRIQRYFSEIGKRVDDEFKYRLNLHNDFRSHIIAEQQITEGLKNPDSSSGMWAFFYNEMNTGGIPVAQARRLLSRAFQNRLAGTEAHVVDSANFVNHEDNVMEVVIDQLVKGSGGSGKRKVTKEEAELAASLAYRIAYIEHEQANQEYTMKQKQPDKFRDYMWFNARQVYYAGKDRAAATFFASVYLFAEPAIAELLPGDFRPVVLTPDLLSGVDTYIDSDGKLQFKPQYDPQHPRDPGYTLIGDLYHFAETDPENPEYIFDEWENRYRIKLLSDVVAEEKTEDDVYGYTVYPGERLHEDIDWSRVHDKLFQYWINQLWNVKDFTDKVLTQTDMSANELSTNTFYEQVRVPSDYSMNSTYFIRDADISLLQIAKANGVTEVRVVDTLKKSDVSHEAKVDSLMRSAEYQAHLTAEGITEDQARTALMKAGVFSKLELQMRMHEIWLLGVVMHNHVEKKGGLHGRWDESARQEVTEVLNEAAKAGFIRHESIKWIQDQIPRWKTFITELMHAIAERTRREGV